MEIIEDRAGLYGPQYVIGNQIKISRNRYKDKFYAGYDYDPDSAEPTQVYYLQNPANTGDDFSIGLTHEQMLEVVAAFLLVYESYDHPEGEQLNGTH